MKFNQSQSVVQLTTSQVVPAAGVLALAMQNSPYMRYLIGDAARMLHNPAINFYQAVIRIGLQYGEVHTTPAMDGIAVWIDPEKSNNIFGFLLKTGYPRAVIRLGLRSILRFFRSSGYLEKLKEQTATGPFWTLIFLGVEPSQRGKGIGGKLIQPILGRGDAEGLPCFVESSDERSLAFYNKHGFRVVRKRQVPGGGPQVWGMVRDPGSTISESKSNKN